ncbi:MAG: amidohydrolase family protein [Helicobacteraceae bacterium]|nr:amidohydrolase family protein [Helicobacteraceae bacterium]
MILKNATICDESKFQISDIQIKDDIIVKIDSDIKENDETIDCRDKIVMPQFIDLNIFPKNKSLSRKNLESLAKKAKNGGVGILILNSNTNPKIDNEMILEFIKSINKELEITIYPLISSTDNENKLIDISILNSLGGIGVNLQSSSSSNTIDKIAKYAKMLDIPVFVNADDDLGGVINYGEMSAKLGLPARNPLSEIKEVAKILEVAIFYNIKVIFQTITETRSIHLINEAKKTNPNIFCETSIHHLLLNDTACDGYNTLAKINPPLKDKKSQEALIESFKNNQIDLLTSMQCACYKSLKEQLFEQAEYGIDTIGSYFSLIYSYLIKTNITDLQTISRICSKNPAMILGLNCGEIKVSKEAKLMIIDINSNNTIEDSPYNKDLFGKVQQFI